MVSKSSVSLCITGTVRGSVGNTAESTTPPSEFYRPNGFDDTRPQGQIGESPRRPARCRNGIDNRTLKSGKEKSMKRRDERITWDRALYFSVGELVTAMLAAGCAGALVVWAAGWIVRST